MFIKPDVFAVSYFSVIYWNFNVFIAHSPLRTSKKKVKYQVLYYVKITNLI